MSAFTDPVRRTSERFGWDFITVSCRACKGDMPVARMPAGWTNSGHQPDCWIAPLLGSLGKWRAGDPWERVAPGEGLVTTDEPYRCYACGVESAYIEPDTSQPEWWAAPDHNLDTPHEPDCLWVLTGELAGVLG